MKRKRHEANLGFPTKPKIRRIKKLTLSEKIREESPKNVFMLNEIVLATVPGYCIWPASILQINGETIMVKFFGTGHV